MDTTETNTEAAMDDNVATEDDATSQIADADNLDDQQEPETFPRSYVEELRQENGRYRQRAQQADQYAQRLHTELVRATGRLADPTDLAFNADHLDDPAALAGAINELLARKPHLVNRRPVGDIGQGVVANGGTVDLAAILRHQAG